VREEKRPRDLLLLKGWNIEYCISSYSEHLKHKVPHRWQIYIMK